MEAAIVALIVLSLMFAPGANATEPTAANGVPDAVQYSTENVTTATPILKSLPAPDSRPAIAVYEVADKTGQYKENGTPTSSRAVTQGATEMLITALMRSNQFRVLGRVDFQHILNEQTMQSKGMLNAGTGPELGKIIGADYVIEGAITEYDVDRTTGGIGLKIAGKGASTEYARASCAIDLRLTDTTTGEIVWVESLKKEIYGRKIGLTVFSFFDRNIVEFETGKGMQEAINLVVRSLIEEAVYQMIQDLGSVPVEIPAPELLETAA